MPHRVKVGFGMRASLVLAATLICYGVAALVGTGSSTDYPVLLISIFVSSALIMACLRPPTIPREWLQLLAVTTMATFASQAAQVAAVVLATAAFLGIPGTGIPTLGDPKPITFLVVFWLSFSSVYVVLLKLIWMLPLGGPDRGEQLSPNSSDTG